MVKMVAYSKIGTMTKIQGPSTSVKLVGLSSVRHVETFFLRISCINSSKTKSSIFSGTLWVFEATNVYLGVLLQLT
jgi:hypothetical protein